MLEDIPGIAQVGWQVMIGRAVHLLIVMIERADIKLVAGVTLLQMGFDRLQFRFPPSPPPDLRREDISTALLLNRRPDDPRPKVTIDVPWYGGGMSFGSTNIRALLSKARAAKAWNTFSCTGEGGYPPLPDPVVPVYIKSHINPSSRMRTCFHHFRS